MGERLWQWLFAVARWIWEARRGWGTIALVAAIVFAAIPVAKSLEDGIRYAGMILQILGVVTVAIGLRDKRQTFERPGLVQIFRGWLSRFPKYAPKSHVISMQGVASASAVGSAYAYGWHAQRASHQGVAFRLAPFCVPIRMPEAAQRKGRAGPTATDPHQRYCPRQTP